MHTFRLSIAAGLAVLLVPVAPSAQNSAEEAAETVELQEMVVLGTRVRGVSYEDLAVPVDVYEVEEIATAGTPDLGVALQKAAPSFNSKRNAVGDGGLFHTATLRGMSPDHTLLLINGKRRHGISFPRPLDTAGQGTTGADLRTIPVAAIDRIEVLRDGAATQYGSDAIGGVINIVLKENPDESTVSVQAGTTQEGDGQHVGTSVGLGMSLGPENSVVNLTAEFYDQNRIDRAFDTSHVDAGGPHDPPIGRKIVLGEPEHDLKSFFFNANSKIDPDSELYAFGGLSTRNGISSGAWRDPNWSPDRMVGPVHPDGFLPLETSVSDDRAVNAGLRSKFGGWNYDASVTYGSNEFNFGATESINASWAASWLQSQLDSGRSLADITPAEVVANSGPASGDSGGTTLDNLSLDLDITGAIGNNTEAAFGAEYREERFRMRAGDFASWGCGTSDNPGEFRFVTLADDGTVAQSEQLARCGHQGYPGYSPTNARFGAIDRDSHAVWADLRHDISSDWNVEGAARYESYEGAGDSLTGMVGSRYHIVPTLSLRATASTGFRAPSLPQLGFNTIIFGGGGAEGGLSVTAHLEDGAAHNFFGVGSETLRHEESRSVSAGLVWAPRTNLSLTADAYHIDLKDRVTLVKYGVNQGLDCAGTDEEACRKLIRERQLPRISDVQFFDNAVDTRTTGLDVVANLSRDFMGGDLLLTGALHFNRTEVTAGQDRIGNATRSFIERGNPRQQHRIHANWSDGGSFEFNVGVNYFGKSAPQWLNSADDFPPDCPGEISPGWIADASAGFNIGHGAQITFGVSNLLDEYPDEISESCSGILNAFLGWGVLYNPDASYGLSGRIWYTRLNASF